MIGVTLRLMFGDAAHPLPFLAPFPLLRLKNTVGVWLDLA